MRVQSKLVGCLLRACPRRVWGIVGSRLATPRPVGWYPGWQFGMGESEGTLLYRLRLRLWSECQAQRRSIAFPIPWVNGLWVNIYLGNDFSQCLYVAGAYEPNEFAMLAATLEPSMVYIDVGANDGLYTLFASSLVGATGMVVALEPSEREFARLQANLQLNRVGNVRCFNLAAGDLSGSARLRIAGFGHEGHNTLGEFVYDTEQAGWQEVHVLTLDALVEREALARVDFVKIDAEGAELRVLKGGLGMLTRFRPVVQFELLDAALAEQGSNRAQICDLLEKCGYLFFTFGRSGRPEPALVIDADGINVLAVHPEKNAILKKIEGSIRV